MLTVLKVIHCGLKQHIIWPGMSVFITLPLSLDGTLFRLFIFELTLCCCTQLKAGQIRYLIHDLNLLNVSFIWTCRHINGQLVYRGKQRNSPSCSQDNTVMRLGLQLVRQLELIIVYLHADPLYLL